MSESGAEIVPIWGMRNRIDDALLRETLDHWQELRAGRVVPLRSEVDPRAIETVLEYSFLAERTAPGQVRLRIAGAHLNDLMGMEVRGMPLRSFIDPFERARFSARIEQVFTTPEIQLHHMSSEQGRGGTLFAKMMLLPLRSESGAIDRALGCLISDGPVGLPPRRFHLLETETTCLSTNETVRDRAEPAVQGFAEAQEPFRPQDIPRRADGRPDLRVVT
ncbi:MAG: PAS domain-containing protein [Paracoccaceae bacterium]